MDFLSSSLLAISIRSKIGIQKLDKIQEAFLLFAQEDHRGPGPKVRRCCCNISYIAERDQSSYLRCDHDGIIEFWGEDLKTAPGDGWFVHYLVGEPGRRGGGRVGYKCVKWFTDQIAADILERHID